MAKIKVDKFDERKFIYEYAVKKNGLTDGAYLMEPFHGSNGERYYDVKMCSGGEAIISGDVHNYASTALRKSAKSTIQSVLNKCPIIFRFVDQYGKVGAMITSTDHIGLYES